MHSNGSGRPTSPCFVETLESRTMLCAGTGTVTPATLMAPAAHSALTATIARPTSAAKAAAAAGTKTTIRVSPHSAKAGLTVNVTATVKAASRGTALSGVVGLLDNGTVLQGPDGPIEAPLASNGTASFTLGTGSFVLFPGKHSLSAEFVATDTTLNSTSKATTLTVTSPKLTTTSDQLQIGVVKKGSGKTGAAAGQMATVRYTGLLASNGQVFDFSSRSQTGTLSFTIGSGELIQGFDEGVVGMKVGETRVVVIPSALGYGSQGFPPAIPGDATLVFTITLVSLA